MKHRFLYVVLGVAAMVASGLDPVRAQDRVAVSIGVVVDGPWERNDEILDLFQQEITAVLSGDFDVRFPAQAEIDGGWTAEGVRDALDRLLEDPDVDLVLTVGVLGSVEAGRRSVLPKPVIAPLIWDANLQAIPRTDDGTSGVTNLNYLEHPAAFLRDLRILREVVPFRRLGVLRGEAYVDGAPELWIGLEQIATSFGVELELISVGRSADAAVAAVPPDVEAVYLFPLTQLDPGEFDVLVTRLIERRLPSFSFLGVEEVERGILVGLNPETFWVRLARRIALNTQRILLGEDAGSLSVAISYGERLTLNMGTASAIGVSPSWQVVTEAEEINDVPEAGRRLTLAEAVRGALDTNLNLAVENHVVAAGSKNIGLARSQLLPQLDVSALTTLIDADRAEASIGSQPQRTLVGGVTATQLLYSEPAWANVGIQDDVQLSRAAQRDVLRLDVIAETATAYLNVLRANTFERIQRENVRLTRANLERARVRRVIGAASPAEVFRWESEIARGRSASIQANSQRNVAEIALNRVRHRPLEEPFSTVEVGLDNPSLLTGDARFFGYFINQATFRVFRTFMSREALAAAPELEGLAAAIDAQRRVHSSASNSFWAPTVALQAGLTGRLAEGGAGTQFSPDLPPGSPDLSGLFPQANDVNLSLGLSVSLPVFLGGSRFLERSQSFEEFTRLEVQQAAVGERVEQRVRTALHFAGSSYAGIGLAREGADAARNNLELVGDAYTQGLVSIIDLIDAQNAALVGDLGAATAVYDFLVDWVEAERAVGRFSLFMTAAERDDFFDRLDAFVSASGGDSAQR